MYQFDTVDTSKKKLQGKHIDKLVAAQKIKKGSRKYENNEEKINLHQRPEHYFADPK